MALLTAIVTHLGAEQVRAQLADLDTLAPGTRRVVCHGGSRADFEELGIDDALFIDDPSLRGPSKEQSYNAVLRALYQERVRNDSSIDLVYFMEFDQLVLRGDFEQELTALAERSGAGLLAKGASPRNDTNWPHYLRFREDERFNRFIAAISRRGDLDVRFGCLGTGMLFTREALEAFAGVADGPHAYLELFIPTVVHHLGFEVADVDALSDLYSAMRWRPEYTVEEAIAAKREGRTFVHPFKELGALNAIRGAS
jgi:hypothetical protein